MFGLKKGDRVKTNSDRYKGIVKEVEPGGFALVHIKKASRNSYLYKVGEVSRIDIDNLLRCAPFFSRMFLALLFIVGLCLVAPLNMGDLFTWGVWTLMLVGSFAARSYQYFVQWR